MCRSRKSCTRNQIPLKIMQSKIVYSLGRRGFFSEINNLVLAIIYSRRNNYKLLVNSLYWNCRVNIGLGDYFSLNISETINPLSAQMTRTGISQGFNPRNPHDWFYKFCDYSNGIYELFNKNTIWGKDIYEKIRSNSFRESISKDEFSKTLCSILTLNQDVKTKIESTRNAIKLPKDYIGIHIRRGDKITTGEMENISLDEYVDEIKKGNTSNIYIATDDLTTVEIIRDSLGSDYRVFYNPDLNARGFDEGSFNKMSKQAKQKETETLLTDMFILFGSKKFIGTYSSNLSRVVPCVIGFDKCVSLDNEWVIG